MDLRWTALLSNDTLKGLFAKGDTMKDKKRYEDVTEDCRWINEPTGTGSLRQGLRHKDDLIYYVTSPKMDEDWMPSTYRVVPAPSGVGIRIQHLIGIEQDPKPWQPQVGDRVRHDETESEGVVRGFDADNDPIVEYDDGEITSNYTPDLTPTEDTK